MFISSIKSVIAVSFTLLLTACAVSKNVSEQNSPLDSNIDSVSYLGHKNLIINNTYVAVGTNPHQLENSQAGSYNQLGLIGFFTQAILLNGINSDIQQQQKLLHPIRSAIINYNYGSKLRIEIEKQLTLLNWLNVNYVGKYPNLQIANSAALLEKNSEDNLVIVDSSYSFSEEFNSINVICHVAMHSKQKPGKISTQSTYTDGKNTLIYQKKFNYTYELNTQTKNKSIALKMWSENNGKMIAKAFNVALKTISKNIATDMNIQNKKRV